MADLSVLLCSASRAASATGTTVGWRGLIVCVPPACCAPPFVLPKPAGQSNCGWVRIVRVPLLQQPAVGSNGAAAAEPSMGASTVAEGAHDALCCLGATEVLYYCIPLMHLAASGAAIALQPNPLVAAMSVINRLAASISPGVPPAGDAGKVRVGQGLLPLLLYRAPVTG